MLYTTAEAILSQWGRNHAADALPFEELRLDDLIDCESLFGTAHEGPDTAGHFLGTLQHLEASDPTLHRRLVSVINAAGDPRMTSLRASLRERFGGYGRDALLSLRDLVSAECNIGIHEANALRLTELARLLRRQPATDPPQPVGDPATERQLGEEPAPAPPDAGDTPPADSTRQPATEPQYAFRAVGEYWDIRFGEEHGHFPDSAGLRYIAALLARPLCLIPALDLVRPQDKAGKEGMDARVEHSKQEVSDNPALQAYLKRFNELRDDLETAKACGHAAKAADAQEAMEALRREMQNSKGLSGKRRRLGPASREEKACNAVRQAIRRACEALERARTPLPLLARHLRQAIQYPSLHVAYLPAYDREQPAPDWVL